MPTLVPGNSRNLARNPPNRGFTLIEILVVLVIVGIALGTVVVQLMPNDRAQLREEAGQLALLLENAELEARSSGAAMAWLPETKGYQFWRKNQQGNWKPIEDGPYRFRAWKGNTRIISVSVDNEPFKLGELMILGAASFPLPFEIRLEHGAANATIEGDGSEAVSVQMGEGINAVRETP
jgi:general secretion pathway protein H